MIDPAGKEYLMESVDVMKMYIASMQNYFNLYSFFNAYLLLLNALEKFIIKRVIFLHRKFDQTQHLESNSNRHLFRKAVEQV